jgi:hypothetical protein
MALEVDLLLGAYRFFDGDCPFSIVTERKVKNITQEKKSSG